MAYIRCKGAPLPLVFGDASDANGQNTVTLETATWNAGTEDTGVIEKQYKNLVIPSGVTINAGNRNSGIIIRCQGNCTIEGDIYNLYSPRSHSADLSAYYPSWMVSNGTGGNGGAGGDQVRDAWNSCWPAESGAGQTGRYYGGGYSGGGGGGFPYGTTSYSRNNVGGSATGITTDTSIFVGGTGGWLPYLRDTARVYPTPGYYGGGGGGMFYSTWDGTRTGGTGGGDGGNGAGAAGCQGGYPSRGEVNYGYAGGGGGGAGNYGGGVIILYVAGTLTVSGGIYCNGSNGGTAGSGGGPSGVGTNGASGGGGGGGGRIYLMSKGTMTRSGTFNVSGGTGGAKSTVNNSAGGAGHDGSAGTKYYISFADFNNGAGEPTAF